MKNINLDKIKQQQGRSCVLEAHYLSSKLRPLQSPISSTTPLPLLLLLLSLTFIFSYTYFPKTFHLRRKLEHVLLSLSSKQLSTIDIILSDSKYANSN